MGKGVREEGEVREEEKESWKTFQFLNLVHFPKVAAAQSQGPFLAFAKSLARCYPVTANNAASCHQSWD